MDGLTGLLGLGAHEVVAIVGSGGKTTLLWRMAGALRSHKTLVATTTKIFLPAAGADCYDHFLPPEAFAEAPARPGITLAGSGVPGAPQKLGPLPGALLQNAAAEYPYVLLEADGAAQKPLKGWAAHEPVVPPFTTCTIGVVPVWPLGRQVDETLVHRLPQFCAVTGCRAGQRLSAGHLAAIISGENGLFAAAKGRRVLFFSQAETPTDEVAARQVLELLPAAFLHGLARAVCGSAQQDVGEVLWQRE